MSLTKARCLLCYLIHTHSLCHTTELRKTESFMSKFFTATAATMRRTQPSDEEIARLKGELASLLSTTIHQHTMRITLMTLHQAKRTTTMHR